MQPESVKHRISLQQPLRQRNSRKLIAALLISNLLILAYFLSPKPPTPSVVSSQETAAPQAVAPTIKPAANPQTEITPPPLPPARPLERQPPAIASIVAARTTPPPPKPAVVKKPLPTLEQPAILPAPPVIRKAEPAIEMEPARDINAKPAPLPAKSDLPFLEDLPSELRRSLPNFTINVFSYSTAPAQRFVMIDMVKYVPGQRIKDLLDLKDIREDSIVVAYNDVTFKIKRP